MMKLIFLGPPGAGKGTQSAIVSKKLNIPAIATGDILRAAVKEGTEVGLRAKSFMDAGQLVPDEIIIDIVAERLAKPDCAKGYILDGVPRTIAQAQALECAGVAFDHVISIEVPDSVVKERLEGRRTCLACGATYHITNNPPKEADVCDKCGHGLTQRKDDHPETVSHRLGIYHSETEPLKSFYEERGVLRRVDYNGDIESVNRLIMAALEK